MKNRNTLVLIIILIVAIVSMGAGYVIAETSSETINAAYSLKTGFLRFLTDPNDYNPKSEVPVSWNIQGIKGEPGPQGPAGEQGPQGIAGPQGLPGAGFSNLSVSTNNDIGYIISSSFPVQAIPPTEGWSPILFSDINDAASAIPSPSVTVDITSGKALVMISSIINYGQMSFAISGNTNREVDENCILYNNFEAATTSSQFVVNGLNSGLNTFTLMYKTEWQSSFDQKSIIVIPLP